MKNTINEPQFTRLNGNYCSIYQLAGSLGTTVRAVNYRKRRKTLKTVCIDDYTIVEHSEAIRVLQKNADLLARRAERKKLSLVDDHSTSEAKRS